MLPNDTTVSIHKHINSSKGRHTHYSFNDSKRLYLPETLNIKKMHQLYANNKVSYGIYRNLFNTKHSISFRYPTKGTCSSCDSYKVNIKSLEDQLAKLRIGNEYVLAVDPCNAQEITRDLKKTETEHELHLHKAQAFYSSKRKSRLDSKNDATRSHLHRFSEKIYMSQILQQTIHLSVYIFNIHSLSSYESIYYTYTVIHGKKGADDVASMLWDLICNHLDDNVEALEIYSDSYCDQNNNYTIFRFLHNVAHYKKLLKKVTMTFPEHGHSYMALTNQKAIVETPSGWNDKILTAHVESQPSKSVCVSRLGKILDLLVCYIVPFCKKANKTFVVVPPKKKRPTPDLRPGEFRLPARSYKELIPINEAKYKDLQVLKNFCEDK
ncbi:hypothetical protein PR048_020893 [Dryococelus australis]|uniref:Uncharacterized protein n=1 Tax=Dryococelus australis TaxID=614101 RepID=A0ABQ9GWN7_9NEOP|nr:hypothetical protein PR048_020893 [Dryococelus australis]